MPPLSRHFSLDGLCHAGETWRRLADLAQTRGEAMPANLPLQPATVSWHPIPARVYVEMRRGPSGRLVPCQRPIASL